MSDNIRIKTTPGEGSKNVNIKINQKFDFIEILSLKISQSEAYRRFCSDYGVVVGRVIVNNGVGVPNAKVSIFIPIDNIDVNDSEIFGLYPYEVITDTDDKGIPYNLVPRNNRGKYECYTPVGTFPSKREIQDNPEMGDIYCDYYKFTTTTNESGDFMIFGVPVGTHFMHVDADISDIGALSQRPYDLIREGVPSESFHSGTKFKGRNETKPIKQLKTTSPISVTVPPFWGDTEECEIGIARTDIDLATTITPQAIFMGSIISDNDKHALSRICIPRKKLGKMDELVTGEGRIEMIRKTNKDKTERFDVEGGEVIDSDGTWAYQIPMNRDYMITAEDGTFIPSEDPTKGIPTKAKVRFRIGMNIEGDEGRLRTRAKFLVPHNPETWVDTPQKKGVDFSFDSTTHDDHFTELSWNKIYTVKNHITRTQARGGVENRNFIGLKNVDDSKNRNPFPFNKLDNDLNPLYYILCILIKFFARIVGIINGVIICIINLFIMFLNFIMRGVCGLFALIGRGICGLKFSYYSSGCRGKYCMGAFNSSNLSCNCDDIFAYTPYITLKCSADDSGLEYAPRGRYKSNDKHVYHKTWNATFFKVDPNTEIVTETPFHYVNDGALEHKCTIAQRLLLEGCDAGWSHCQTLALADALDVFKFDFYNDWINGSLYSFLLKYKVKRRGTGTERFCEVDCGSSTGVDNNKNGRPDNPCKHNYIVDTCTGSFPQTTYQNQSYQYINNILIGGVNSYKRLLTRSGYIKKHENELYYSPITKDGARKLYATDIVNLGSVFDCDWEGKPKLYNYLSDTTFNIPPLVAQYEILADGTKSPIPETTGFDTNLGSQFNINVPLLNVNTTLHSTLPGMFVSGLIGNITCVGFATNSDNCNNIKRLCELGVGLDEKRDNSNPNNRIGNEDIEQDYVRGIFTYLNTTPTPTTIPSLRIDKTDYYDYQDTGYDSFRSVYVSSGFNPQSNSSTLFQQIWVYKNSYYFYFGLNKGKTALSKMNSKFFAECAKEPDIDFFVIATNITGDLLSNGLGAITIEPSGGVGPYVYFWNGPTINGNAYPLTNNIKDVTGLYAGTYTVTVSDSVGNVTDSTFIIPGPPTVKCNVQKTDINSAGGSNGEITVNISNGTSPYTMSASTYDPTTLPNGTVLQPVLVNKNTTTSRTIPNLSKGYYIVKVTDSSTPITSCETIINIIEPQALQVTLTPGDVNCFGEKTGSINTYVSGGISPYKYSWSNGGTSSFINGLEANTYDLTIEDNNGTKTTNTVIIKEPKDITYNTPITVDGNCNGSLATIEIKNINGGNGGPYTTTLDTVPPLSGTGTNVIFDNKGKGLDEGYGSNAYTFVITDVSGCTKTASINVYNPAAPLTSTLVHDASNRIITINIYDGTFNTISSIGPKLLYETEIYKIDSANNQVLFRGKKTLTGSIDKVKLPQSLPKMFNSNFSPTNPVNGPMFIPQPDIVYVIKVRDKNGNGCLRVNYISIPQI